MLSSKFWGQLFHSQPAPEPRAQVTPDPMDCAGHVGQFLPTGHPIGPSAELWEHDYKGSSAAGKSAVGKIALPDSITATKILAGAVSAGKLSGRSATIIAVDEAMEKMERKLGQKRDEPERRVLGTGHVDRVTFHDDRLNDMIRVEVRLVCSREEAAQLQELMNRLDRARKLELSQLLVDRPELSPSDDVAETASDISTKSEAVGSW